MIDTLEIPANAYVSETELIASVCRDSYADFLKEFLPVIIPSGVEWNWHLDVIANETQEAVERLIRGEDKWYDLLFNISPGTTKSSATTIGLPAWAWCKAPHLRFICSSYADPLAIDLSRRGRDIVLSDKYRSCFPEVRLRSDQSTKHQWGNTLGGMRYCAGAGGSVLGMHGDVLIVDDPIDPTMVLSPAETAKINYWITRTLNSRKVNKRTAFMLMVMQRLGVDDPSGAMLERPQGVRHICLPATSYEGFEIKPPELANHYIDGLMDPHRLPKEHLEEQKGPHGMGIEGYSGQYGQSPLPMGGGKFKTQKIRWGPTPERFKKIVRGWDKAVTPDKGHASILKGPAFTVGFLMAEDMDGDIWFLDVQRQRVDSAERERLIKTRAARDGRGCWIAVEKEPGSAGTDSFLGTARRLKGYKVIPIPASGSKEARADEFSRAVNNGLCYIPRQFRRGNHWIGWAKELVEEMMYWPNSKYLDQVDAGATAYTVLVTPRRRAGGIVKRRQPV